MKKIILSLCATVAFSGVAQSAEVPHCWSKPGILPGYFLVMIKTDQVSKEGLVELLARAQSPYLEPKRYPEIQAGHNGYVVLYLSEVRDAVQEGRMTREQLQAQVKKELQLFVDTLGVTVECMSYLNPNDQ